MSKKYELLQKETITFSGQTRHRIRALSDIPRYGVKKGDLGGYVENEHNLDHEGDAWIGFGTSVFDKARVSADARICEGALVSKSNHILSIGPIGENEEYFTLFPAKDGPKVNSNFPSSTLNNFEDTISKINSDNLRGQEYRAAIALARLRVQEWEAA